MLEPPILATSSWEIMVIRTEEELKIANANL
jgi:acetate kinase